MFLFVSFPNHHEVALMELMLLVLCVWGRGGVEGCMVRNAIYLKFYCINYEQNKDISICMLAISIPFFYNYLFTSIAYFSV